LHQKAILITHDSRVAPVILITLESRVAPGKLITLDLRVAHSIPEDAP
jgi:hypothetical protein